MARARLLAESGVDCIWYEFVNPTGPVANRPLLSNPLPGSGLDIIQAADFSPSRIARFASGWLDAGAQIVGGCCASGPEYIAAIHRVVSAARPPASRSRLRERVYESEAGA